MTVEDLKTSPEYVTLAPSQRAFTLAYCTNGADKVAAAKAAGALKDEASALATANRHLRTPAIKRLVDTFYKRTDETGSKTEALAIVWKKIQSGFGDDHKMLLEYLKLYGVWKGFEPEKPDTSTSGQTDYVSQLQELEGTE